MRMLGTHFVAVSVVLLSGLLFLYNPVPLFAQSYPNDTNAHFGKNGACANGHMATGDLILTPQTFALCKGNSGAFQWYGEIRNYTGSVIVCTSGPLTIVTGEEMKFTCDPAITQPGYYKGYVYWKVTVNGQTMPHYLDYFFRR